MFTLIDRYLLRETLKGMLTILSVLMLILVGHAFISNLRRVAAGALTNEVIVDLLGLEVLRLLGPLVPAAFFFSMLFTLGRMYRDSEMIALASCGIGTLRIYRAFLYPMVPLVGLVAWLMLVVVPQANQSIEEIRHEQKAMADLLSMAAGRFNEYSRGDLVFYIEELSPDRQKLRNIFVQNRQHGKLGLITAKEGYQTQEQETGDHFIVLVDGHRYEGEPGQAEYSVGDFAKYAVRVGQQPRTEATQRRKSLTSRELWQSNNIKDRAELQYRLCFPLAVIVFTFVSVPLSRSVPRQGIYGRLFLAFLVYFTFFNLLGVSGSWMTTGVTPGWLGRWWVLLLLVVMVLPLILRDSTLGWTLRHRLLQRRQA